MKSTAFYILAALALTACRPAAENQVSANRPQPATAPNAPTILTEPKGTIDPKSAEAAGQVVQSYGALIEQRRFPEARLLWSDPGQARAAELEIGRLSEVHLEIGSLGDLEAAAGSIYVAIPVVFYGKLEEGEPYRRSASLILRRVNDIPGATEEQLRWRIERIEWKEPA